MTETSRGEERTRRNDRAAAQLLEEHSGRPGRFRDRVAWKMGSPGRVGRDPTPTRFRDLAARGRQRRVQDPLSAEASAEPEPPRCSLG